MPIVSELEGKAKRATEGRALRIYIYHGNARRPDPSFLANFDAVITTYATLATEFSRQTRSLMLDDDDDPNGDVLKDNESEPDERADPSTRPSKLKTNGKRKKPPVCNQANNSAEISSALQSVHWFRVVLDEAQ
jgi:SNF2 family DNA or RNA helicase